VSDAVICRVRVTAAHDGVAELVVTLRHGNGALSEIPLDDIGAAALFDRCNATSPEQLEGHGWERVREALAVSWNRFTTPPTG
jgi:hypothetical protein